MDSLIIVCLDSGNHSRWRRKGARSPAWWQRPGLRAPFFVRRPCWRAAPSVSCTAGEGVEVSQGEGLRKVYVGQRTRKREASKESLCNGQYARQRSRLSRP
jgi:hypothetical protein